MLCHSTSNRVIVPRAWVPRACHRFPCSPGWVPCSCRQFPFPLEPRAEFNALTLHASQKSPHTSAAMRPSASSPIHGPHAPFLVEPQSHDAMYMFEANPSTAEKVGDVVPFSITPPDLIALAVSAATPCRCSTGCHTLWRTPGRYTHARAKSRSLVALEMHNLPQLFSIHRRKGG
jgi:hypothetical protein